MIINGIGIVGRILKRIIFCLLKKLRVERLAAITLRIREHKEIRYYIIRAIPDILKIHIAEFIKCGLIITQSGDLCVFSLHRINTVHLIVAYSCPIAKRVLIGIIKEKLGIILIEISGEVSIDQAVFKARSLHRIADAVQVGKKEIIAEALYCYVQQPLA